MAAASWERAELAVQTKTIRGACSGGAARTGQRRRGRGIVESQLNVAAAPVAFGADPADHAGLLQDPEMVGQQVGAQPELAELAGRGVAGTR